jgi:hypothetical protein
MFKKSDTAKVFNETIRIMRRRAARGVMPHQGALTGLGDPFGRRWKRYPDLLVKALKAAYDESSAPLCALGVVFWASGCPVDKPRDYAEIAALGGIPWNEAAAIIALSDAGFDFGGLADALASWRTVREHSMRDRLTSRAILRDVKKRLDAANIDPVNLVDYGLDVLEGAAFNEAPSLLQQIAAEAFDEPLLEKPKLNKKPGKPKGLVIPLVPKPLQADVVIS